jgi:NAD(P)-dependent dehydrogenase (short-subunit alcohol dehydrogenase family)
VEVFMTDSKPVAIVTGASRGLGAVIARVLAARGYELVLGARDARILNDVADAFRRVGGHVAAVAGDVADADVRAQLVEAARRRGGLDVLVNNASELGGIRPIAEVEQATLRRVFDVNVAAPVALIQLALPLLRQRRGLVVNVSSDAAVGAYPGWSAYGASKAALDLITRTADAELRREGIAAVSVDPGDLRTRLHQQAFPGEDISDRPLPDVTIPFWHWLFDQDHAPLAGERFRAQTEDERWLQRA